MRQRLRRTPPRPRRLQRLRLQSARAVRPHHLALRDRVRLLRLTPVVGAGSAAASSKASASRDVANLAPIATPTPEVGADNAAASSYPSDLAAKLRPCETLDQSRPPPAKRRHLPPRNRAPVAIAMARGDENHSGRRPVGAAALRSFGVNASGHNAKEAVVQFLVDSLAEAPPGPDPRRIVAKRSRPGAQTALERTNIDVKVERRSVAAGS